MFPLFTLMRKLIFFIVCYRVTEKLGSRVTFLIDYRLNLVFYLLNILMSECSYFLFVGFVWLSILKLYNLGFQSEYYFRIIYLLMNVNVLYTTIWTLIFDFDMNSFTQVELALLAFEINICLVSSSVGFHINTHVCVWNKCS